VLEVQNACFNEFPDQCIGCPEYSETRQDQATQLMLLAGMGMTYPPFWKKIVKECKLYHKRKVEYLRYEEAQRNPVKANIAKSKLTAETRMSGKSHHFYVAPCIALEVATRMPK